MLTTTCKYDAKAEEQKLSFLVKVSRCVESHAEVENLRWRGGRMTFEESCACCSLTAERG